MPLVQEMRHPRSLDFHNERKVVILRDQGCSFAAIAGKVLNRMKERPPKRTVAHVYRKFSNKIGVRKFHYHKSGRKPYKLTEETRAFLIRRLLHLRKMTYCTSSVLQKVLAKERGMRVDASSIRSCRRDHGSKWLRRSQKRKYNSTDRKARREIARFILKLKPSELSTRFVMDMDGVICARPPSDPCA